jgi:hypothetical protein
MRTGAYAIGAGLAVKALALDVCARAVPSRAHNCNKAELSEHLVNYYYRHRSHMAPLTHDGRLRPLIVVGVPKPTMGKVVEVLNKHLRIFELVDPFGASKREPQKRGQLMVGRVPDH